MNLSGSPIDYLIAFLGGVVMSFTPCVYPLIPVSAAFIGVKAGGSKIRGLVLSLVYVTGIAITYSILGILAALTGTIFGRISTNPVTNIIVGIVIIIFGLFMLDIFKAPGIKIAEAPDFKKKGYLATFLLGLSSGLIISPCVTPALGAILTYLAAKKHVVYGATVLFSFAYGMGFILILSGTFSALLLRLPKSGRWMVYMKKIGGIVLLVMGIYFMAVGIKRIQPDVALAVQTTAPDFLLQDLNNTAVVLSSYKDKQPVLLFFWTTWCPFCVRELRKLNDNYAQLKNDGLEVLPINIGEHPVKVRKFLESRSLAFLVLLDKDTRVASAYGVLGIPTYILVDKNGQIVFEGNSFPQKEYKALIAK